MIDPDGVIEIPVTWTVNDLAVHATLTRPGGTGPFPAVVMVAGSGPTDRNWNSPLIPGTNGSAALLARALAAQGFITLRYDKTGSGPHAQENAQRMAGRISMLSHFDELVGGVRLLTQRTDVDAARLFVLGNSEGCLHALYYQTQARPPFAGLVLTSGFARPAGALARQQIAAQLAALPDGKALLATYDAAMADFSANRPVTIAENLPEGMRMLILGVTYPGNQPFARELWTTDPLALLTQVTAPVLILLGKKDLQVDWQTDGPLFETAARERAHITVSYADNANHVLKHEPRERAEIEPATATLNYNTDTATLDDEALGSIVAWLKARA